MYKEWCTRATLYTTLMDNIVMLLNVDKTRVMMLDGKAAWPLCVLGGDVEMVGNCRYLGGNNRLNWKTAIFEKGMSRICFK